MYVLTPIVFMAQDFDYFIYFYFYCGLINPAIIIFNGLTSTVILTVILKHFNITDV